MTMNEPQRMTPRRAALPLVVTAVLCALALGVGAAWLVPGLDAATDGSDIVSDAATGTGATLDVARGHGVAHDPRATAAIDRWMALGQVVGAASAAPPPGSLQDAVPDQVITIRTQGSNLEFVPAKLSAKSGTRVRVDYVNDGVLPHNFVILHDDSDLDALGSAAYDAEATGFVPLDQRDKLVAYTSLASPGTTVSVIFVVPDPGEYTFVCLFPGHYNVMLGTFRALR